MSQFNLPNLSNSQVQFSSENHQSSLISTALNPQDVVLSHESSTANGDVCHVTVAAQPQLPQQAIQHPNVFFFRPPNDSYHYHVICEEISDNIEHLLKKLFNVNDKENVMQFRDDEYIFFYQQKCNNRFYQVTCEIVSPLLVNNCLNKNFLGFELQQQNMEQERLAFNTFYQKENLEGHLKQYLSQYLLN